VKLRIYWARVADVDFEQGAGIGDAIEYSGVQTVLNLPPGDNRFTSTAIA
jgi:hypothetical protein